MRTNIVIDDKLMAEVMAYGEFKTKREAVEEGLRMLKRRKVYDGLLALRGQLRWDDSDEGWARYREEQLALKAGGAAYDKDIDPLPVTSSVAHPQTLQEPAPASMAVKVRKTP